MSMCGRRAGSGIATTLSCGLGADGATTVRARAAIRSARLLAAAVACIACALLAPVAATAATGPEDGRPQRDIRDDSATVPAAQAKERAALDAKLGDESVVNADGVTGGLRVVARTDGLLTAASGDDAADVALSYVRANGKAFGLDANDLSSLRLISRYRSFDGVTHLAWAQTVDGIASFDGVLRANVRSDGRLVNVSAPLVADLSVNSSTPGLSASDALAIAKRDARGALQMPSASGGAGAEQATTFSNGDTARLVVFASKAESRLAWRIKVAGEVPFVYDTVVDAASGAILARNSLTDFLASASVTENYPGAPSGGVATTQDLDGPDGTWLNLSAGDTKLDGNNAHTYADINNNDAADPSEEVPSSGGGDFLYPRTAFFPGGYTCPAVIGCSWDPGAAASKPVNQNQVTTQLHYLINRYHDWLLTAPIGFDEGSRNFENVHTSAAPGAGDRVLGESNDGGGLNNANFDTPPDGFSPTMQMYFTDNNTAQDTGEDAAVVFHEYTHGLSNRLVGNAFGLTVHQSQAMGEGWSDWYALDYLQFNGYETDTAANGELKTGRFTFAPDGVRTEATDCAVGAASGVCPGTVAAGSGGYTYGDLGKVGNPASPHPNGEIWAQTLWDLRNAVGSVNARCLVTGGMRLSPLAPSFLDMRDAILAANVASCGNTFYAQIWTVFAARGMGFHAVVPPGGASANSGAVDNFDLPVVVEHVSTTITDPAPGGDGDGVAEPGETITVVERLKNSSVGAVTGITGTMTTSTPGVTIPTNVATWPNLPAPGNQADSNPPSFRVTIPVSHACGAPVQLSISIDTDQDVAGSPTIPVTVPTGTVGPPAVFSNTTPVAIPDNSATGVTSTIIVPAGANISDLDVRITDLDHTYVGDLKMTLKGPDNTTITLMNRPGTEPLNGSTGDNFTNTVLDDEAMTPIEQIPGDPATDFTGSWKPDQALSAFDGKVRAGTWTLTVSDNAGDDTGTLNAWALLFNPAAVCSTSVGYSAAVLADNPGGYWRFGEASGTVITDSSGHGNNGTYLNGVALGAAGALIADPNKAATWDGVNDSGRVPDANSLDMGASFTIEGWIKRAAVTQSHEMFNKGGNGLQLVVMNAGSGSQVWLRKANVTTLVRSAGGIAAGGYHYIVATMNGAGTGKIYIDGVLDTVSVSPLQAVQDTAFPLTFGSTATPPATFDEFALYDGVLTQADVTEHYLAGHGP
jgi:subtilisin-like proprotein convertase family protein